MPANGGIPPTTAAAVDMNHVPHTHTMEANTVDTPLMVVTALTSLASASLLVDTLLLTSVDHAVDTHAELRKLEPRTLVIALLTSVTLVLADIILPHQAGFLKVTFLFIMEALAAITLLTLQSLSVLDLPQQLHATHLLTMESLTPTWLTVIHTMSGST